MMATHDTDRARRYLLGLLPEQEQVALEEQYLADQDAADRVAAAEDDLIEDYLADRLAGVERERFEQGYLSAPHHRIRVETVRRLQARARAEALTAASALPREASPARTTVVERSKADRSPLWLTMWMPQLALAASLVLVAGIAWLLVPSRPTSEDIASTGTRRAQPPDTPSAPTPRPAPTLLALALSPVAVRSAEDSPSVVIPAGTDQLSIRLEGDGGGRRLTPTRAAIRTVAGGEVWQGPVSSTTNLPSGTVAQIDVPTTSLEADDYLVTLYGTDASNTQQEWMQYLLRVRRP